MSSRGSGAAAEALQEMQHIADATAAARSQLKASKIAKDEEVTKEGASSTEVDGSASIAEAYFRQHISESSQEGSANDDSFQVDSHFK